ncbi:MAG: glycoside hydrolase family 38 C-terminal domain-containing protein, partial [Eubacteriales bacterium]
MDSNLIGGESLIRQFFYGKQFFQKEFGQDMNIFWVPDSFGYSACIPQVMKLANVPYFLTQKMSWNTVNKFPYHSFYWQGLDGSKVLAHMLPENTYNGPVRADYMKNGEKNYQEREISDKAMMLFGIGDGGAGPGFEHIERLNRFRNLKDMPKVKPEKAKDFFKKFDDGVTPYPTHKGELYLERHQGTYTTQSKNKRFNRKCEFALRNYEMLAVLSNSTGITAPINKDKLDTLWKEVLLYQFHDILPGSSINRVYEESVERYEIIYTELQNAIDLILTSVIKSKAIVNLNSFAYNKNVKLGDNWYSLKVPALGCAVALKEQMVTEFFAESGSNFIENDKIRIEFKDGCVSSFFDKALSKEMVMKNEMMAAISQYTDEGDCWDIGTADYAKTKKDAECVSSKTGTDGAKAFAICELRIGDSTVKEEFFITDNSNLLSCDLTIDCHQESSMLRIAFPTAVETDECNFNIQFGHISRKTTENDSVEKAQYEVSGQKFVDMSEESFGLSFINDCKYGYRCKGGIIDLDLIRSPKKGPGKNVDQGEQTIHYALMPHDGKLGVETYREAYLLNNPFI